VVKGEAIETCAHATVKLRWCGDDAGQRHRMKILVSVCNQVARRSDQRCLVEFLGDRGEVADLIQVANATVSVGTGSSASTSDSSAWNAEGVR